MMSDENNFIPFDGELLCVVEGTITEVHTASSSMNLLSEIERRMRGGRSNIEAMPKGADMHSALASAFSPDFHESEDMFNFAGIVNGAVVFGRFSRADKIQDGDRLKLVVSQRGEVLYVHSLVHSRGDLIMLPTMVYAGDRAFFKSCMRTALWLTVMNWVAFSICVYFASKDEPFREDVLIIVFCMILIPPPIFFFLFELWTYRTAKYYGLYASTIFKALKFPDPDYLDVRSGLMEYKDDGGEYSGINWRAAIDRHKNQQEKLRKVVKN